MNVLAYLGWLRLLILLDDCFNLRCYGSKVLLIVADHGVEVCNALIKVLWTLDLFGNDNKFELIAHQIVNDVSL
jgi:hypothetical protein